MRRLIGWIAVTVMAGNFLMLFPATFYVVTGTNILPLPLIRHFDPHQEANLFTWYSSLLLIIASMSALVNFGLDSLRAEQAAWRQYAWLLLCAVTLFLSLDEVAMFHESIGGVLRQQLQGGGEWGEWASGIGKPWIIAYTPAILAVIGSFLYVFLRLWREHRSISLSALAGLTLWIAAIGLTFLRADICRDGAVGQLHCDQVEALIEEACEIFGTSGLLIAFVWYAHCRVTELVSVRQLKVNSGG